MRILQVAGSAQWAGGERQLLDLLGGLDRSRFTLGFVLPEHGPLAGRLEGLGAWTRVVPLSPLGSLGPVRELASTIREFDPAIVQSHGARSNFYARLACRRSGRPNISTVHNSLFDYEVPAWRRAAYLAVERALAGSSAAIVCVCEALRRDWVERLGVPAGLVRVLRNGVDAGAFDPARADRSKLRRELGLSEAQPLVGLVGRMTEQKGHGVFLEAFALLSRRRPDARAVFIGDGPLRHALEACAAELGLSASVRFAGVRGDMADSLAALDVLALPSVSEGLPYALLEALAMGRPAVASAVNGVPEILDGGCGLLVPPRDAAALADALGRLLAEPEAARRMAERGRAKVRAGFSLPAMLEGWSRLYEELGRAS